MQWSEAIKSYINALQPVEVYPALIERILSLLDYTSLNDNDSLASLATFLERAKASPTPVAAVCVLPPFVRVAATAMANSSVQVATVANFPDGSMPLEEVLVEIGQEIEDGAQEVDVVFPYDRYLAGEEQYAHQFVVACKAACGEKALLKVILETGALNDPAIIADASYEALTAGADFIKTSTGKRPEGATFEAAATMLLVLKHLGTQLKRPLGLKVSGGIRTIEQAAHYIELADKIMGRAWVTPETFRIGASKLFDELST